MRRDPTEFRKRFKRWKAGERVYDSGYATPTMKEESDYRAWKETMPVNLLSESDYNLRRAYQLGYKPKLQDDGYYHLPTRDEKTGEILKGDFHHTLLEGLAIDNDLGYIPIRKNGKYYTKSWLEYKSVPAYDDGKTPEETYYGGQLPLVNITGYAPLILTTHYPITSEEYPYTGHSELKIPIDRQTFSDYQDDDIVEADDFLPYLSISKSSNSNDYNLITNNCADATLLFLNRAFGKNESPWFFTTPGDVQDFAIEKLGGTTLFDDKGKKVIAIPRNENNYKTISEQAIDFLESAPAHTAYKGRSKPDVVSGYYAKHLKDKMTSFRRNVVKKKVLHQEPFNSPTFGNPLRDVLSRFKSTWYDRPKDYDLGKTPKHYDDGTTPDDPPAMKTLDQWVNGDAAYIGNNTYTDQCAQFANALLNNLGYNTSGNAWNPNQRSLVYSGYDVLNRPLKYDRAAVEAYNHAATKKFYDEFDSKTLDQSKVYTVNMFYNGSSQLQNAYNEARDGVAGSHTGVVRYNKKDKDWEVVHNIHGKVYVDKFTKIQDPNAKYGITAIYEPRLNNAWNNAWGSLMHLFGGGYDFGRSPKIIKHL